jgi:flagellar hook-length control protein FliK
LLASQLLQSAPPEKLDAQLSVTDASAASDGTATASASSTTNGPNTLPTHLHALASHTQGASDQGPREIRAPVGTHAWTRQLGDELAWMAQQGRDSASLKLSPEHLGPLEVRISMREGEATVWFGATHADTRSALEQALPRLRELFASQGLTLADAGVFREAPRQQPKAPTFDSNSSRLDSVTEASPVSAVSAMAARLLDTYA